MSNKRKLDRMIQRERNKRVKRLKKLRKCRDMASSYVSETIYLSNIDTFYGYSIYDSNSITYIAKHIVDNKNYYIMRNDKPPTPPPRWKREYID